MLPIVLIVRIHMVAVDGGTILELNAHMYSLMVVYQHIPMDLFRTIQVFYGQAGKLIDIIHFKVFV